jgi:DNA-binding ferritin-like protein
MNLDATTNFASTLLHSAATAHVLHFQVTGVGSDAAHRALQEYYEEIPELVDSVVESVMGKYKQILPSYLGTFMNTPLTPLAYMEAVQTFVNNNRKNLPQDPEIQNEVDAIANLLNQVVYRLTFLK